MIYKTTSKTFDDIHNQMVDETNPCSVCGKQCEYEIDESEEIVWISCPEYLAGNEEHDSHGRRFSEF